MGKPEDNIFDHAFSKGRHYGYMEALKDMLEKEERVIMLVDEEDTEQAFQTETFVVESKHIRVLGEALTRDRKCDN